MMCTFRFKWEAFITSAALIREVTMNVGVLFQGEGTTKFLSTSITVKTIVFYLEVAI